MVTQAYLTSRPPAPSGLQVFFDQRVMPVAIDAAAGLDRGAAVLAERARGTPLRACLLAGLVGFAAGIALRRQA